MSGKQAFLIPLLFISFTASATSLIIANFTTFVFLGTQTAQGLGGVGVVYASIIQLAIWGFYGTILGTLCILLIYYVWNRVSNRKINHPIKTVFLSALISPLLTLLLIYAFLQFLVALT